MSVSVEISVGELIDKITILQIKSERIADELKLVNVRHELALLTSARDSLAAVDSKLAPMQAELRVINEELWEIEDAIRECERRSEFDANFVELARSVYKINDRRADTKRRINELTGSPLIEEKSYAKY